MNRRLLPFLVCLLLTISCASPGALLAYAARDWSFAGIGILGGLIGLLLGLGPIIYRTTLSDSLQRVFKRFVWTIVKYNLDDVVDPSPIVAGEPDANALSRRDAPPLGPEQDPFTYADRGVWMGGILGVAFAVACISFSDFSTDEVGRPAQYFLGALVGLAFGAMNGFAFAICLVPGRHRLNLAVALVVGLAIAAALAVRLSPGAKDPTAATVALFVVLPTICVFVATLSLEVNFGKHGVPVDNGVSVTTTDALIPVPAAPLAHVERSAANHRPGIWAGVISAIGLIAWLVSFVASQLNRDQKVAERTQQEETRTQAKLQKETDRLQKLGPLVVTRLPDGKAAIVPKLLPQILGRWRLAADPKQSLEFRVAGVLVRHQEGVAPEEASYRFVEGDTVHCWWSAANGDLVEQRWRIRASEKNTLELTDLKSEQISKYVRYVDSP